MQFCDYKEIDTNLFHLNVPEFDYNYNIFISRLLNTNTNVKSKVTMNIKSDSLRLLDIKDGILQVEFLYSSNDFYEFINGIDSQFKEEIIVNGSDWFGNNLNNDTINNIFKQSVNLPVKIPGLPTINFRYDDNCKISGIKRKKLSMDDLKPNMEIELHFTVEGIYFYKNRCHLIHNVKQIKILNDTCQSFESLFGENDEDQSCDVESETNDVTASAFMK